jgi:hypothetical protein
MQTLDTSYNGVDELAIERNRPTNVRPPKPAPLSRAELREQLNGVGESIDKAGQAFETDNANLDEYYRPLRETEAEIGRLKAALAVLEEKAARLKERGTPLDTFTRAVAAAEIKISGLANAAVARLTEDSAKRAFGISADRLSTTSRRDLETQHRDRLQRFMTVFYHRVGRTNSPNRDQVVARVEQIFADINEILETI